MLIMWLPLLLILFIFFRPGVLENHYRPHGDSGPSGPMEILRERYARGEINDEEFRQRKQELLR